MRGERWSRKEGGQRRREGGSSCIVRWNLPRSLATGMRGRWSNFPRSRAENDPGRDYETASSLRRGQRRRRFLPLSFRFHAPRVEIIAARSAIRFPYGAQAAAVPNTRKIILSNPRGTKRFHLSPREALLERWNDNPRSYNRELYSSAYSSTCHWFAYVYSSRMYDILLYLHTCILLRLC